MKAHTHDRYAQLRTFLWTQWRHENGLQKTTKLLTNTDYRAIAIPDAPWTGH